MIKVGSCSAAALSSDLDPGRSPAEARKAVVQDAAVGFTSVPTWDTLAVFFPTRNPRCYFSCAQFVKGDIQSLDQVLHLLASEEVDTVMHFAAQVGGAANPLLQQYSASSGAFASHDAF